MIQLPLFKGSAYRIHVPRWAYAPTSGAGAGEHGGRLNRVGLPALYLSLEEETALAEYKQLSALMPPGLMVSYELKVHSVIDFSNGYTDEWDSLWQELHCDWRSIWFNERIEPPSWLIGDMAIDAGAKGILFPSQVKLGGTNLVIFTEALSAQDELSVYDPRNQLPRDSSSWE